jgi:hypothetical protein
VSVTGTVFSVNSGIKGSRVAVLQGAVQVVHSGIHTMLHPGDQMTTSDNLAPASLEQQFSWSPDREKYVGLLAELAMVEHRIGQIPFPQPRYSSDLLPRVPADTLLYITQPGLSPGQSISTTRMSQTRRCSGGKPGPTTQRKRCTGRQDLADISHTGDEAVVVVKRVEHRFRGLADVEKSGLSICLRPRLPIPMCMAR